MKKKCKRCDSSDLMPRSNNEGFRTMCRSCYNEDKRKHNAKRKALGPVGSEKMVILSNRPVVKFLSPWIGKHTDEELGLILGVDPQGLRRHINGEYENMKLDYVDRIFIKLGHPGGLMEYYPHLYEFTEEQMAEAEKWAKDVSRGEE